MNAFKTRGSLQKKKYLSQGKVKKPSFGTSGILIESPLKLLFTLCFAYKNKTIEMLD